MRIILDTGVLFHPEVLGMMKWYAAPVIVPAIVFAERCRQIRRGDGDLDVFRKHLRELNATIEPLDAEAAIRYAAKMIDDRAWARLARDALIAGHVRPEDRLFTTNLQDFLDVGVPRMQIIEIPIWRAREQAKMAAKE